MDCGKLHLYLLLNEVTTFTDVPVWSKLETGRIPQPPELFQIIDNHVRFNQNTNTWSDNI